MVQIYGWFVVTMCCFVCVVPCLVCLGRPPIGGEEGTVPTVGDDLAAALHIPADADTQGTGLVCETRTTWLESRAVTI